MAASVTYHDLIASGLLVLLCVVLSFILRLGLHRAFLIAAARMAAQILMIGAVLGFVFVRDDAFLTASMACVMLLAAITEACCRQDRRLAGAWHFAIIAIGTVTGTAFVVLCGLLGILHPHHWYEARLLIPLTGLLLGGVMNATSLAMSAFLAFVTREARAIEARIILGAGRTEAMQTPLRQAIRMALMPTLNQMAAAGLVTLPGIMTGQILAGMNPYAAARSQIVLLSLILTGNLTGAVLTTCLCVLRLTDDRGRLRLDRLRPEKSF